MVEARAPGLLAVARAHPVQVLRRVAAPSLALGRPFPGLGPPSPGLGPLSPGLAARVVALCRVDRRSLPRGSRLAAPVEALCRARGDALPRQLSFAARVIDS